MCDFAHLINRCGIISFYIFFHQSALPQPEPSLLVFWSSQCSWFEYAAHNCFICSSKGMSTFLASLGNSPLSLLSLPAHNTHLYIEWAQSWWPGCTQSESGLWTTAASLSLWTNRGDTDCQVHHVQIQDSHWQSVNLSLKHQHEHVTSTRNTWVTKSHLTSYTMTLLHVNKLHATC